MRGRSRSTAGLGSRALQVDTSANCHERHLSRSTTRVPRPYRRLVRDADIDHVTARRGASARTLASASYLAGRSLRRSDDRRDPSREPESHPRPAGSLGSTARDPSATEGSDAATDDAGLVRGRKIGRRATGLDHYLHLRGAPSGESTDPRAPCLWRRPGPMILCSQDRAIRKPLAPRSAATAVRSVTTTVTESGQCSETCALSIHGRASIRCDRSGRVEIYEWRVRSQPRSREHLALRGVDRPSHRQVSRTEEPGVQRCESCCREHAGTHYRENDPEASCDPWPESLRPVGSRFGGRPEDAP